MTRRLHPLGVAILALIFGAAAFFSAHHYYHRHRDAPAHLPAPSGTLTINSLPELDWLRRELSLTPDQFEKVAALHAAYRPHCMEMCGRIAEAREKVAALSRGGREMTPALAAAIQEHARTRADCQEAMTRHLYETAALMDPGQSARYLEMMLPCALDCQGPEEPDENSAAR